MTLTLQSWAAQSLCIRVVGEWANAGMSQNDVLVTDNYDCETCPTHDRYIRRMLEMQMPPSVVIPRLIRYQIDDHIMDILDDVTHWIGYHHAMRFFHDEPASSLDKYLVALVWRPNRTVDFAATARNVVINGQLSDMEKFRFASLYCLVDQIGYFEGNAVLRNTYHFETEPFMLYWSKYLTKQLHTIPLGENASIEIAMFKKALEVYDLWLPTEYFFSRLDPKTKVRQFISITNRCGRKYRKQLLKKLDDPDWQASFQRSLGRMVVIYAECGDYDDMRRVWMRFKDEIDCRNLCRIVTELVPLSMESVGDFNVLTPFLVDVWNSAAETVKNRIHVECLLRYIGTDCSKVVDCYRKKAIGSRRKMHEPTRLLRLFLSRLNPAEREKFLRVNFRWMVLWQPLAVIDALIKDMVVDEDGIDRVKAEWKSSTKFLPVCAKLLRFGEFDEFNDIVWYLWFNERYAFSRDSANDYQLKVLTSTYGLMALSAHLYLQSWQNVYEFVCGIFSRDSPVTSFELMTDLVNFGFLNITIDDETLEDTCFVKMKICRGELIDLKNIMEAFNHSAGMRIYSLRTLVRSVLIRCLFDEPEIMAFKRSEISEFLRWSYVDDPDPDERFRTNARPYFSIAFFAQLEGCVDEYTFEVSDSMEEFLQWCFPDEAEKQSFKRDMIYRYYNCSPIGNYLAKRRYRRRMLHWFFDHNLDLIETFQNNELIKSSRFFYDTSVDDEVAEIFARM